MNEYSQGILGTLALIPSVLFSLISWIGGRSSGRIYKRLLAPILFCSLVIGLALLTGKFSVWMFLSFPAYLVSCSVGYGGVTFSEKVLRRSVWSVIRSMAALTFCISTGSWFIFIFQAAVGLMFAIAFGTRNPLKAPQEEGLINFSSVFLVPQMVL